MRAEDIKFFDTVRVDPKTGFPMMGSMRAILHQGSTSIMHLREELIRFLGKEKMSVFLGRHGFESGAAQAVDLSEQYDFDNPEEWLKAAGVIYTLSGYANIKFEEIIMNKEEHCLRFRGTWKDSLWVQSWFREYGVPSQEPVCVNLVGFLSGYASMVLGAEVLVKEVACQASGCEVCAFEGRSLREWGVRVDEVPMLSEVEPITEIITRLQDEIEKAKEETARHEAEIQRLKRLSYRAIDAEGIICRSESMTQTLLMALKVAPTLSNVLIRGESGTGKEVLAQFIHQHSGRKENPFIAVNCAALPSGLLESELFGHVKGAFTGADRSKKGLFVEAGEGTLFLDEISELPFELQAKLLRAIQEREVRPVGGSVCYPVKARIVAASNQDMNELVLKGRFREDLFYRLSVFPIVITPLRQRKEDIIPLAKHFLARLQDGEKGLSPEAARKIETYPWPGNARELENWIEYAVIMSSGGRILAEHFPASSSESIKDLVSDFPTYEELLKRYIAKVLEHTRGNKTEASKILGMSMTTLWRKLKEIE